MAWLYRSVGLVCVFWSVATDAANQSSYFDPATRMNSSGGQIGEVMGRYKPTTKENGPEQRQADLALIWAIGETGSICAILGGNVVGAAGLIGEADRAGYLGMVEGSLEGCKLFLTEKITFLETVARVRSDRATVQFATELASSFRELLRIVHVVVLR